MQTGPARIPSLFVALAAGVVIWRVLAWVWPSSTVPVPAELRLPLGGLGLLFLFCGLAAVLARPDAATRLFCLHGLGQGVHWGGAVGSSSDGLEMSLFFVYLAATALAEAALLRLAWTYPQPWNVDRVAGRWLYLPALLALALAPVAGVIPVAVVQPVAVIVLLLSNLFGLVAGVLFLVRLVRADSATRRANGLGIIVAATLGATGIAIVGSAGALPGLPEAYNLAYGLIPAAFLYALLRRPAPKLGHSALSSSSSA